MIKRSRQREAIRQCLTGRYDHPTAETVYMSIKDEFPNISLGTVYRNLSLLSDLGEIQKITVSGGPDRFDGNPAPHYHFSCRECGCVMDLDRRNVGSGTLIDPNLYFSFILLLLLASLNERWSN